MRRIDTAYATSGGLFQEGDPVAGSPATRFSATWCNAVQEELVNVVLGAGLTLDPASNVQVVAAVQLLAGRSATEWMNGRISRWDASTLDIPSGAARLGSGTIYLIQAVSEWSPVEHTDDTFTSLALGDDIYIYAVAPTSGIYADLVASKNADVPDGYLSTSVRRIGGFHYGRVRGVANRYSTSYSPSVEIVPNSVWDLFHRPRCEPAGMVEVIPGLLWADIYLNSIDAGVWPATLPLSRYNATPLDCAGSYIPSDFSVLLANAGKRLPTVTEFFVYADGAPAGLDGANTQAWSATANTSATTTGAVAKAVSSLNVVDAVGNLAEVLETRFDIGDSGVSTNAVTAGKDAGTARGSMETADFKIVRGGGHFSNGVIAGSRAINITVKEGSASDGGETTGFRGVCPAV